MSLDLWPADSPQTVGWLKTVCQVPKTVGWSKKNGQLYFLLPADHKKAAEIAHKISQLSSECRSISITDSPQIVDRGLCKQWETAVSFLPWLLSQNN